MITRLIEASLRHPGWVMGVVALVTAGFVAAVALLGIGLENDFVKFLPQDNPAVAANTQAKETYGSQDLFLVSLVAEDTIFKPETLAKFKAMEEAFEQIPGVDTVRGPATADVIYGTANAVVVEPAMETVPQTPEAVDQYRQRVMGDRNLRGLIISEDGKAGAISITLEIWADAPSVVAQIEDVARPFEGPETLYMAGEPVLRSTVANTMVSDLQRLIPFVILVMVAVLLLSFRTLRGVLLPLVVVLISTLWALGTMAIFNQPMTPFAVIMPVMLIAIGAADSIHILNKYNEEAASRSSRVEVVRETMREMASPVILTSLTTAAGFLALFTSFLWPQRSLGVITAAGVLYSMMLSLTFIPALLARLPLPKRKPTNRYESSWVSRALGGSANWISKRPGTVVAASFVVLLGFSTLVPQLKIETRPDEFLGKNHPVVRSMEVMDRYFGGSMQLAIDVRTGKRDGLKKPEVLQKMAALQTFLLEQPEVGQVSSLAKVAMQLNETLHASDPNFYRVPEDPRLAAQIFILYSGDLNNLALGDYSRGEVVARVDSLSSEQMTEMVQRIQPYLEENFNGTLEAEMVGSIRQFSAIVPLISMSQIYSMLASTLAVLLIMALMMRSLTGGIISVIPLVFTLVIAFGSMVLFRVPLDMATLMLGSVAIGIGIDYSIHFINRFKHEARGGDLRLAYAHTMRTTGKGIFFNAIALMLSFAVLLASSFQGNVNFGRLVALTMLVSAASAMIVIPTLFLLKKPAFLDKEHVIDKLHGARPVQAKK